MNPGCQNDKNKHLYTLVAAGKVAVAPLTGVGFPAPGVFNLSL